MLDIQAHNNLYVMHQVYDFHTKFFTQSLGSEEKAKQMINVIASKVQKKEVKLVANQCVRCQHLHKQNMSWQTFVNPRNTRRF